MINNKKLKENLLCLLMITIITFLLYSFKILHFSFSIDTECLINDSKQLLESWYGIGRYGLCLFKIFFHTLPINILLTNLFAIIFLSLCSFLWIVYFELIIKKNLKLTTKIIGMLLISSSPIMMEQIGFVLQSVEIMTGFCLSALGSILFVKYCESKKISLLIISIILIFITFSFYQAFVFLFISSVIMYLICKNKDQIINSKSVISDTLRSIVIFAVIFAVYVVLDKYIINALGLEKTSYLTNQFLWGTESISTIFKSMLKNLIKVYSGYYNCYHPFFTIFSFVFMYNYALKEKKDYWKLFLSICLFFVPAILVLVTGSEAVGRSQFSIVITLAFYVVYLIENIDKKMIRNLAIILIIFQSIVTIYLQVSAQNIYELDKQLANDIESTLQEKNLENKKVAVVGCYNPNNMLKGEVLGHSFFEWDNFDGKTSNGRINGFFRCMGLNNQFVSDEQLPHCYELVKKEKTYFDNKEVYVDNDIVIIKLND